jgi:hypothetical protein
MQSALLLVILGAILAVHLGAVWALLRIFDTVPAFLTRLCAVVEGVGGQLAQLRDTLTAPSEPAPDLADVWDELERLKAAVAEGIAHVERTESRIAGVVGRAQKELRRFGIRHPGVEAEAEQLQLVDGAGGDGRGVPAVSEDMANAPSSVPGVSRAQLMKARARG